MLVSAGGSKEQRGREKRERHPWLFTKHSLFYLHQAVGGLPSPLHLSLISDKALFKCLLSWPIHDWRWHLRNTSKMRSSIGRAGEWVGSVHSILVWSRTINTFPFRRSCQCATAPCSHSSVSGWRKFSLGWWAQWVITFCNESDRNSQAVRWFTCSER